ncbi:hypothetical protein [Chryseobacterium viscerum]|uniref:Uncharacterized protein n=1 Tax=Chryseobacterium viscerum TaxID=1037377 RepID=A0A316WH02_9FLAO|nr:hypothetical protein [Chryseobacterium viscerum]PWN60439.1 hypothetical protein C1634_015970 [Chryseobacterium viscerum]
MKKLITIFSFTKLFHEAYRQNSPLDNFLIQLQELINIDITELIEANKARASEKANAWQEEAYRNFERIGKIGIEHSNELNLDIEPNTLWDCNFMRALRTFNERNFYVASCLSNKKTLEDNDNLIKSEIRLMVFKNVSLILPSDRPVEESTNHIDLPIDSNKSKFSPKIQEKYLDRFINSIVIHTLDNKSKDNLIQLLKGAHIKEPIEFSCAANSVIYFFRQMHEEGKILTPKSISGKFIQQHFMFKWRGKFDFPKDDSIKNYLTRKEPSSVSHKIILVE